MDYFGSKSPSAGDSDPRPLIMPPAAEGASLMTIERMCKIPRPYSHWNYRLMWMLGKFLYKMKPIFSVPPTVQNSSRATAIRVKAPFLRWPLALARNFDHRRRGLGPIGGCLKIFCFFLLAKTIANPLNPIMDFVREEERKRKNSKFNIAISSESKSEVSRWKKGRFEVW